MTTYQVTMYGRDDHGYPDARVQTIEAATPADVLTEPGWEIEAVRHARDHRGEYAAVAYQIRRPADLGDVTIERTTGDLSLWLVSLRGEWVGAVRELDVVAQLADYAQISASRDALIHAAVEAGLPETRIAAQMGIDRMTVRKALGKG